MNLSSAIFQFFKAKIGERLSENTLLDYSVCFSRFLAYVGDLHVADISVSLVRSFIGSLTVSKKTSLNHYIALSSLWTFAVTEGYCSVHIVRDVKPPKPEKRAIQEFSKVELSLLFRAAQRGLNVFRDYAILAVLYDTGIRASELCGLCLRDISGSGLRVFGKGDKERVVPMSESTAAAVNEYLCLRGQLAGCDYVFVVDEGGKLTRHALRLMLKRLEARARVPNVHAHRFRHSFALEFLRRGGNVYALQQILGHSTMEMSLRYLALVQADIQNAHLLASPPAALVSSISMI